MIGFQVKSSWWLIAIPILIVFLYTFIQIHERYTMPAFYNFYEILPRLEVKTKKIKFYVGMSLALICYFFLFIYTVAFIVKLLVEADFSWIGFMCYVLMFLMSFLLNKFLNNVKKKMKL